jgi:hypothetical protein
MKDDVFKEFGRKCYWSNKVSLPACDKTIRRKSRNISARIASVPAEIRNKLLPDEALQSFRWNNKLVCHPSPFRRPGGIATYLFKL